MRIVMRSRGLGRQKFMENVLTLYFAKYISLNKFAKEHFLQAGSVDELKKAFYSRMKNHVTDNVNFKKGARLINWDMIFKLLQQLK